MHTLPSLPYPYEALEPWIDAETMHVHHDKHHQTYVDKLNETLEKAPELKDRSIEDLLASLKTLPENIQTGIRNFGGGHYNHSLFWTFAPPPSLGAAIKIQKSEWL